MVIMGYGHPKSQLKADAVPTRFPHLAKRTADNEELLERKRICLVRHVVIYLS